MTATREILATEFRRQRLADWRRVARPPQLEPGTPGAPYPERWDPCAQAFLRDAEPGQRWRTWLFLAGRGSGKTRSAAETVRLWALQNPGCMIALVARSAADAHAVMVRAMMTPWNNGELLTHMIPDYNPSRRLLRWSNGSEATTYSAEEPKQLKGPEHHFVWADELASWEYPEEAWNDLQFGLRLGTWARTVATTTPKTTNRSAAFMRAVMRDPSTVITRSSTFENSANLDQGTLDTLRRKYEGTRIGRQELYAEVLEDTPGALWTLAAIDAHRVDSVDPRDLVRIVVAIDPSGGSDPDENDEQGIVVAGLGRDGLVYVLADETCREKPEGWARKAVTAYMRFRADRILAEKNFGGDMVESVIRTAAQALGAYAAVALVNASRGKLVRAEPVSALYQQGRVKHVGTFAQLEDQMTTYVPGASKRSPDRMDALVWAITDLALGSPGPDPDWEPQAFAPFRVPHAPEAPRRETWDYDGGNGSILRRRI